MRICVSVIIPFYNAKSSIAECINSVRRQSLRDIEIICVDDGSTDGGDKIVMNISAADKRIKMVSQTNQGAAAARNLALKEARGEYIAFADADDTYPDDECLATLYDAAADQDANVVMGSFSEYDVDRQILVTEWPEGHFRNYKIYKDGWINYCDWQMDFGFHRGLYRRKFLDDNKIKFPQLSRHEDPVFMVNALVAAKRFYGISKIVYRYINKPVRLNYKQLDDAIVGISMNIETARRNNLNDLKKWSIEFMYTSFSMSPMMEDKNKEIAGLNAEVTRQNIELEHLRGIVNKQCGGME